MTPPERPWRKGKHPEYTCVTVEVRVLEDDEGRVWSDHDFQGEDDASLALTMRHGGAEQVAHALLAEALRHETYVDMLVKMSSSPGYLDAFLMASDEDRDQIAADLASAASEVVRRAVQQKGTRIARQILESTVGRPG